MIERQKDRKTERQNDKKTERQKDRKTEKQKNVHSLIISATFFFHKYCLFA